MKELLDYILNQITGSKDYSIEEIKEEDRFTYRVVAGEEIMGLIIGKGGRTLRSIKNLVKIRATLEKKHASIVVEEKGQGS